MKITAHDNIDFLDTLSNKKRLILTSQMFALFPEVLNSKYKKAVLWLLVKRGIVSYNLRDTFSRGGKKAKIINNKNIEVSAVLNRLALYIDDISDYLTNPQNLEEIQEYWEIDDLKIDDTLLIWKRMVAKNTKDYFRTMPVSENDFINSLSK